MDALICQRCGASLRGQDGNSLLECQYCGLATKLAPDVWNAAGRYRAGVERQAVHAAEQAVIARAYADLTGGDFSGVPAAPGPVAGNVCRSCGAPTQFEAGAVHSRCVYCGASLFASADTQARGLDEAARALAKTRLEALKSERYFAVGLARTYRRIALWKKGSLIVLPALAAIVLSQSDLPDADAKALGLAALSLLAVFVVLLLAFLRRAQLGRAERAVRGIATPPDGHEVRGTKAITAWMNAHWWDAYHVYDLSFTYESRAAAGRLYGLPVLVIAAPLSVQDEPFLDVLVSAWFDGRSERGEGPVAKGDPDARRALQERGFTLKSGPSGLHARLAHDESRRRLKQGVDLGVIAELVARIAVSQGGRAFDH